MFQSKVYTKGVILLYIGSIASICSRFDFFYTSPAFFSLNVIICIGIYLRFYSQFLICSILTKLLDLRWEGAPSRDVLGNTGLDPRGTTFGQCACLYAQIGLIVHL
jgi:hypothetical protein